MKRLIPILVIVLISGLLTGCNDDAKERIALRAVKIAAMEYGYGARDWFEWGKDEQTAYILIMTGSVDMALMDAIKENIRDRFKSPVAAQGMIELIEEAGLTFDESGKLISTSSYSLRFLQHAAEGFYLGVSAR